VSWLYFANRLIELPLGMVGVAMGTVQVAELTRALRGGDPADVAHAESRGLELAVGLALPATLGLIVLSAPIVRLLFQHGAFTAADATATAQALMWLALGLPAQVLVKALSPAFFARDDTLTPLWATLWGVAVAIALALVLGRLFGPVGIAAGIACGAWSSALTLIRRGAASFGFSIDAAARRRLPRLAGAALGMGGLLWLVARWLPDASPHVVVQAAVLTALITGGIALYGLLLAWLGVFQWGDAVAALRRSTTSGLRG
jgi:putative peptidoglycan lipid II flippase